MKIKKTELKKALDSVKLFVDDKNINPVGAYIHFINNQKKAMIFATDFISAARAWFDTDEEENFDFCISFNQLKSVINLRNSEIVAEKFTESDKENIRFQDNKTKIVYALKDAKDLVTLEKKCNFKELTNKPFVIKGADLKSMMLMAGYARNEKETQNIALSGVKFQFTEDGKMSVISTDRTRIAVCESQLANVDNGVSIDGVMSDKTIRSISSFKDDDEVKIYLTDNQFIMISDTLETYVTKINSAFPDVARFFTEANELSYKVNVQSLLESLGVVTIGENEDICIEFSEKQMKISAINDGAYIEDYVDAEIILGQGEKKVWVSSKLFQEIIKALSKNEFISFDFRNTIPALGYSVIKKDNSVPFNTYGMLAPKRK